MTKRFTTLLCLMTLLSSSQYSEACTGLKLKAKNGEIVHGRTLEFGVNVDTSAVIVPRGYSYTGTTPLGKGMNYQTKYGAVGMVCFDNFSILDGMNEKGLSVGTFYFPGFASYTQTTKENQDRSLSPVDFPNWLLTSFATLDEVKAGIKKVIIAPTVIKEWGDAPPPFHYIVYDKEGKSVVIEPLKGELIVHDNPFGTFTNSPSFDWHLLYLRNFINLVPNNVAPVTIEGVELSPFGQGSGMVGLPGDFTPPSRFVRATIFSVTSEPVKNAEEEVFQLFHVLNQFDIPKGLAREIVGKKTIDDYTLATVVRDPNNMKYYFRTFEDQTIRVIDLKSFELGAKDVKKAKTAGTQKAINFSTELKPSSRA